MAKKTKITAPVEGFSGVGVGGLVFTAGVAETDNIAVIDYCRSAGYGVDDTKPTRSKKATEPTTPPVDARDAASTSQRGNQLRDAAVDPDPDDFMPPVNAGKADPHGPDVVSPQVHATGAGDVAPGVVEDDPDEQEADEVDHVESALQGRLDQAPGKNEKAEVWKAWAIQVETDQAAAADGTVPAETLEQINGMGRAELIKQYGPDES